MHLRIMTTPLLLFLMVLIGPLSSGTVEEGIRDGTSVTRIYQLHKLVAVGGPEIMAGRKALMTVEVLDYDYAGPNPKHDPSRGGRKPGNGGAKNP